MPESKKLVIILLGPPGSGKGTQAELLSEKLDSYHLETSEIIEKNLAKAKKNDFVTANNKKYFLSKEKRLRESGVLMSPPLITFWTKNKIRELAKEENGIVTSGSPRTLYEGKELIPLLKKLYGAKNIKVILIKLSGKDSILRNSHRRSCELMRHPVLYTKETTKLKKCPLDGSKLVVRRDDNAEIIKIRLKEYKERTFPLIGLFRKQGLKVKEIEGKQSVEGVFKDILKVILR
ncbi:nucleoside monophosphate kinase [Patescibacteria group bacterium]|nr:nucleoside monophosphate kinase [Patescibacteria group bacterium]